MNPISHVLMIEVGLAEKREAMLRIHDIHPHVIAGDDVRYPPAPIGGVRSDWSKEHTSTFEDMLDQMEQAGIASSALVQSSTCYGFDNSYVLDAVAAHPDRFTAVGTVDMLAPDAVQTLKKLINRGVSGLRIYTGGSKLKFDYDALQNPKSFAVWDFCGEAGLPICLQVRASSFPIVEDLARRFTKTRIILDHYARIDASDGPPYRNSAPLWSLAQYGNIYLKVTPLNFRDLKTGNGAPDTFFPKLVSEFGSGRIAFGSNYPSKRKEPLKSVIETAKHAFRSLGDVDRNMIFSGTAEILYPKLRQ